MGFYCSLPKGKTLDSSLVEKERSCLFKGCTVLEYSQISASGPCSLLNTERLIILPPSARPDPFQNVLLKSTALWSLRAQARALSAAPVYSSRVVFPLAHQCVCVLGQAGPPQCSRHCHHLLCGRGTQDIPRPRGLSGPTSLRNLDSLQPAALATGREKALVYHCMLCSKTSAQKSLPKGPLGFSPRCVSVHQFC